MTQGETGAANGKAPAVIAWNRKHYEVFGIMKAYRNMGEFANVYTSQMQTRGHSTVPADEALTKQREAF